MSSPVQLVPSPPVRISTQQKKQAKELLQVVRRPATPRHVARVRAVLAGQAAASPSPTRSSCSRANTASRAGPRSSSTSMPAPRRNAHPWSACTTRSTGATRAPCGACFEQHPELRARINEPVFAVRLAGNRGIRRRSRDGRRAARVRRRPESAQQLVGGRISCAVLGDGRRGGATARGRRRPRRLRRGPPRPPRPARPDARATIPRACTSAAAMDRRRCISRARARSSICCSPPARTSMRATSTIARRPAEWMLDGKRGAGRYELARYLVERGASADIFLAAALGLTDRARAMLEPNPHSARPANGTGRVRRAAAEQLSHLLLDDRRRAARRSTSRRSSSSRKRCRQCRRSRRRMQRLLFACRSGDEASARALCASIRTSSSR